MDKSVAELHKYLGVKRTQSSNPVIDITCSCGQRVMFKVSHETPKRNCSRCFRPIFDIDKLEDRQKKYEEESQPFSHKKCKCGHEPCHPMEHAGWHPER